MNRAVQKTTLKKQSSQINHLTDVINANHLLNITVNKNQPFELSGVKGLLLDNEAFIFAPLAEGKKKNISVNKNDSVTQHKQEGNWSRL